MEGLWLVSHISQWFFMVVLGSVLLALARQIGILHMRLGPAGALMGNPGLEIGEPVPSLEVTDIHGRLVTLGSQRLRRTLLLFLSPGCPRCSELLPILRTWHQTEGDDLEIVLISQELDRDTNLSFITQHRVGQIPYVISRDLAVQYRVGVLPYAIVVDRAGHVRAKGLVNDPTHLESLLNAEELGHPSIQSVIDAAHKSQDGTVKRAEEISDARTPRG